MTSTVWSDAKVRPEPESKAIMKRPVVRVLGSSYLSLDVSCNTSGLPGVLLWYPYELGFQYAVTAAAVAAVLVHTAS